MRRASVLLVAIVLPACSLSWSGEGLDVPDSDPDAGADEDTDFGQVDLGVDTDPDLCGDTYGSCRELHDACPQLSTGYYDIGLGHAGRRLYCDMDSEGGGWTRVTHFSASEGRTACPGAWIEGAEVDGCVVTNLGAMPPGQLSAYFQPMVAYTEVRGMLSGYQGHSTDGFGANHSVTRSIDDTYVDGVSITHGEPRQHIWTYASGLRIAGTGFQDCPCVGSQLPPDWVGTHFDCDSGNPGGEGEWPSIWHTESPLWDGMGPCEKDGIPRWFSVKVTDDMGPEINDAIEVRLMVDQGDDDVAVTALELYVR